jgi:hypothetical protein
MRPWASGLGGSEIFTEATSNDGRGSVFWPKAKEQVRIARLALRIIRNMVSGSYFTTTGLVWISSFV